MDRISNLPEPIIHHIMSFLTTLEVTRTSVFSKTFRSFHASFPNIDFDQTLFRTTLSILDEEGLEEFLNYVNDCIERQQQHQLSIHKFRLQFTIDHRVQDYRIDEAICFAIEKGVKELDLDMKVPKDYVRYGNVSTIIKLHRLHRGELDAELDAPENIGLDIYMLVKKKVCYSLPESIYSAKSISSLKLTGFKFNIHDLILGCPLIENLRLSRCNLLKEFKVSSSKLKTVELKRCDGLTNIEIEGSKLQSFSYIGHSKRCDINVTACKSLRILSVVAALVSGEWVSDQISNLSLLEVLELRECNNLKNIRVSNTNMKKIVLDCCNELESIEIEVPNLESFLFARNGESKACKINIDACELIKDLTLKGADITDEWLKEHVSKFLELENLRLESNHMLKRIEIFNGKLRSFQLLCCNSLAEVKIDTPELLSFIYNGKVVSFGSMISPNLVDPTLSIERPNVKTVEWFVMLRELLVFFDHCNALTLDCVSDEDLIFPEEVRGSLLPPLYDIRQLRIKIKSLSRSYAELVDGLLWLSPHPDTLYIVSGSKEKSIEFQYDKTAANEDLFCCRAQPIKCWRHYLKIVEMHNFVDSDRDTDGLLTYFSWNAKNLDTIGTSRKRFKIFDGKYLEQSSMIN